MVLIKFNRCAYIYICKQKYIIFKRNEQNILIENIKKNVIKIFKQKWTEKYLQIKKRVTQLVKHEEKKINLQTETKIRNKSEEKSKRSKSTIIEKKK